MAKLQSEMQILASFEPKTTCQLMGAFDNSTSAMCAIPRARANQPRGRLARVQDHKNTRVHTVARTHTCSVLARKLFLATMSMKKSSGVSLRCQ